MWIVPFDFRSHITWLRIGIALVWLLFGLVFKLANALPRHRQIVARVVGQRASRRMTMLVALGESALGMWMLTGRFLPVCVGIQMIVIVAMNTLELRYARDLLASPALMVIANGVLLGIAWYVALSL
jgi:hypothetical protein